MDSHPNLIQEPLFTLQLPIELEEPYPTTVVDDKCTYVTVRKGTESVVICFEEPEK